jgi:maleate cis-trans isomerase
MYGWRGRIGLILPSNNTVAEPEIGTELPDGISLYAAKVLPLDDYADSVRSMSRQLDAAREALAFGSMDAIAYGCMMSSVLLGRSWEEEVVERATMPFATAGIAMCEELRRLEAERIAIFNPYPRKFAGAVIAYFEAAGFMVVANGGVEQLGDERAAEELLDLRRVSATNPADLFRMWADQPEADTLCILATDLPTRMVLSALRESRGGPVLSTNLAIRSWLLRQCGVSDPRLW